MEDPNLILPLNKPIIKNGSVSLLGKQTFVCLRMLKGSGVPPSDLRSVYSYFIRLVLEYACPVWHTSLSSSLRDDVEGIQRRAIRIIYPHLSSIVKGSKSLTCQHTSTDDSRYVALFAKVTLPVTAK